ncbi:MAG: translation initiation factor IF-2 [Bacteroidales bacterium]|nr:translation initiation factor IF-2 [Bacteroidales bacterium]
MTIRLNRVTRNLNVGISTVVEFLQNRGIEVEANPNAKISQEHYEMLVKEFSKDKNLKQEAEQFFQERQNKERNKETVAIKGYEFKKEEEEKVQKEIKTEVPEDIKPKVTPVGKIDLDNLVKKPKVKEEVVEEKEEKLPSEKKEISSSEKKIETPEIVEKKEEDSVKHHEEEKKVKKEIKTEAVKKKQKETPEKVVKVEKELTVEQKETPDKKRRGEEDEDGVFQLSSSELVSNINVVGQIDLAAINQSTRPKRKTKEEKRKEREKRQQGKEVTTEEGVKKKKKRVRVSKEKVDISEDISGKDKRPAKKRKNFKKPVIKAEVTEEEAAQQVRETLARLTNKRGRRKGSKFRREKRELETTRQMEMEQQQEAESKIIKLTEFVTVAELANMMSVSVNDVISTCMSIGIMVSINQRLDAETISLVADEYGFETEFVSAEVAEAVEEEDDNPEDLKPRAPIVTVMGHVDHGKTSLLDYIRKENVIAGEAGGITQHIGAYNVTMKDGRKLTFLDTPGHEAFTAMRARGAKVTDIAIIIVAADDNVMPQTKEAINHATAAGVPIIFAINKVDKPTANPDKIKEELAAMNFLVEDWGGEYQSQDISAKKGTGVAELMEKVLLEAEMLELKANPDREASGTIIESTLDKGRGYVATVLVANGTLRVGDIVLSGVSHGRVRAMFNERNQNIEEAGPSEPALILGLDGAPAAGVAFHVLETEQEAREIAGKREQLQREQGLRTQKMLTLDEVGRRIALGDFQELNIIVKGDVDGSVEALSDSLLKLSTEQIQVNVIHQGVGQISESDVSLAAASEAIIIGFQVRPSVGAERLAEQDGVDIRKYSIIYDAIEEVTAAMEGMLAPEVKEQVTATIEVREVFKISKVGIVAGSLVKTGKVKRSDKARLIRDGIVVYSGSIEALKRFKDDVKEVNANFECGISLTNCNDIQVGDIIETYEEIEVKQKL